jgi:hypothetical protein
MFKKKVVLIKVDGHSNEHMICTSNKAIPINLTLNIEHLQASSNVELKVQCLILIHG